MQSCVNNSNIITTQTGSGSSCLPQFNMVSDSVPAESVKSIEATFIFCIISQIMSFLKAFQLNLHFILIHILYHLQH